MRGWYTAFPSSSSSSSSPWSNKQLRNGGFCHGSSHSSSLRWTPHSFFFHYSAINFLSPPSLLAFSFPSFSSWMRNSSKSVHWSSFFLTRNMDWVRILVLDWKFYFSPEKYDLWPRLVSVSLFFLLCRENFMNSLDFAGEKKLRSPWQFLSVFLTDRFRSTRNLLQ